MSGVDTDWFIADRKDAKKIAAVVMDDEGDYDDWPNLHLPLGEMELRARWAAMLGRKLKANESVAGKLVLQSGDGELFVIEVASPFLTTAAGVEAGQIGKIAAAWAKDEFSGGFTKSELSDLLKQIRDFAARALKAKKPVLQLSTL